MNTTEIKEGTIDPPKQRKRNANLDIIRTVAITLVITVHFCLNIGFYEMTCYGPMAYVVLGIRTFSMICVPLFLLLTGYLVNKKTLTKKYYLGIVKVLVIYLIASIACGIYTALTKGETLSPLKLIADTLNFRGASYSWYVEMYIGLFMLIPFLNMAYHGQDSHKKKLALVLTMIALTILPSLLNIYKLTDLSWFANPSADRSYNNIVPDYWMVGLYPLTYYFIGCYLREFPLRLNRWVNLSLIVGCTLAFTAFNYYRNYNTTFLTEPYSDNYGFQTLILSVLVFSFINSFDTSRMPRPIAAVFGYISNISFGMYLLSQIADGIVYKYVNASALGYDRVKYIIIALPCVFLISAILASAAELIYKPIDIIIKRSKKCSSKK